MGAKQTFDNNAGRVLGTQTNAKNDITSSGNINIPHCHVPYMFLPLPGRC